MEDEDLNALRYPVELLNTVPGNASLQDHVLKFKKGFPVILLRNLDVNNWHVNGTRLIVEDLMANVLKLKVAVGDHKGNKLILPRMPCTMNKDEFPVPGFTRLQFPIRTCFAMTTNKAQGQSFPSKLGLDIRSECFSHGQLYVALSRTTHPGNVVVRMERDDRRTKNLVNRDALQ